MPISKSGLINAIDMYNRRINQCNILIDGGRKEIMDIETDIKKKEKDIEDSTHILNVLKEQLETLYPDLVENQMQLLQ